MKLKDKIGIGAVACAFAIYFSMLGSVILQAQTITPAIPNITNLTCSSLTNASAFCSATDAANLTGTVASSRLTGSYTGITGVGTLSAGAVPTTLLTGVVQTAQLSGATLTAPKFATTTVGGLPLCNAGNQGVSFVVIDSLTPVALAIVAPGGSAVIRVLCNGTAWIVG